MEADILLVEMPNKNYLLVISRSGLCLINYIIFTHSSKLDSFKS